MTVAIARPTATAEAAPYVKNPDAIARVPRPLAFEFDVLPLRVERRGLDEILVLACPDPAKYEHVHRDRAGAVVPLGRAFDDGAGAAARGNVPAPIVCADPRAHAMHVALRSASSCDSLAFEQMPTSTLRAHLQRSYGPSRPTEASPNRELVWQMLEAAALAHAHDLQICPLNPRSGPAGKIRFKALGKAFTWRVIETQEELKAIVSLVKSNSEGIDSTKTRNTQDGRWSFVLPHRELALRVATTPTRRTEGETVTARVLDLNLAPPTPEVLGMRAHHAAEFRRAVRMMGLLLAAGYPGTGKSTTCEAAVAERNDDETFVVGWGDPIEIPQYGVLQVEADEPAGMTQPAILASMTRHAPDYGNAGELRDPPSARLAMELSGIRPFAGSVHADGALDAVYELTYRLRVDPAAVERRVHTIVGQYLVARLCRECRELVPVPVELRRLIEKRASEIRVPEERNALLRKLTALPGIYEAVGCAFCHDGYVRRFGVFELLPISRAMRRKIATGAPQVELEELAASEGFVPMLADAIERVMEGETSMDELRGVPGYEQALRELARGLP